MAGSDVLMGCKNICGNVFPVKNIPQQPSNHVPLIKPNLSYLIILRVQTLVLPNMLLSTFKVFKIILARVLSHVKAIFIIGKA